MATRQYKIMLSRSGLAADIDGLVEMAIDRAGTLHPALAGPARDLERRIQAVLKQAVSTHMAGAKPKAFIVVVEQEMQCPFDPKCQGMIVTTGVSRQGLDDHEYELCCIGCSSKWWVSA